jgi:hypothetical protein
MAGEAALLTFGGRQQPAAAFVSAMSGDVIDDLHILAVSGKRV